MYAGGGTVTAINPDELISTIKKLRPRCKTILDIGCGTAEHHKYLKQEFLIDGLDINEEFIRLARTKNETGTYYVGDMVDFELNRKYDVILCLFSSIGYVGTRERLVSTLNRFREHLNDGGLVMVEDDLKISRMSVSGFDGKLSVVQFHYLVGRPGKGVSYFEERHVLALFSKAEMLGAFEEVGFDTSYEEPGLMGRGMYYGQ